MMLSAGALRMVLVHTNRTTEWMVRLDAERDPQYESSVDATG